MPRRLGVFGGTFDPPHHGHLILASDACEVLGLERLLFVPAAEPPHKPAGTAATTEQRLRMLRAATEHDPRFRVDTLEIDRGGRSYTVDTLRELAAREPDTELVFLLGVDQFRALDTWREPHEVARLARLGVLSRGGESLDLAGPFPGIHVPVRRVDISSSEVRERVADGRPFRQLVPEAVWRVIEAERLYRTT